MYTNINHFIKDFTYEYESTLKIFRNISNETLLLHPNDNIRSIQRLIWHIAITQGEMLGKAGLKITCPDEHSSPLSDIEAICKVYETSAKSVLHEVKKQWADSDLNMEVEMYGEKWTKGTVLNILIKHEAHHRGQLTVLMRLQNLLVPGIYGPSKEEWATFGMTAPE